MKKIEKKIEKIDYATVIPRFDGILARGLCIGTGGDGQMCLTTALCAAVRLSPCAQLTSVTWTALAFSLELNDSPDWQSPASRATHLRDLGVAQLGSTGVVGPRAFARILARKTIQHLLPQLVREVCPGQFTGLVERCEHEGTSQAAQALADAVLVAADRAPEIAVTATAALCAARAADPGSSDLTRAAAAAWVARTAATAPIDDGESYLILSARLACEVLQELGSQGCAWLRHDHGLADVVSAG